MTSKRLKPDSSQGRADNCVEEIDINLVELLMRNIVHHFLK